ncbi:MAG: RluA family pseudouridine synthase [Bacteroidota bacterium]
MTTETELIEAEDQELFEHHRFVVDKGQALLRIDKWLMHRIPNASRNKIQNAAEAESILVNDKPVKSNYKVKPTDVISIVMAHPPRDTEVYPENIPLNIMFEDSNIVIVNKEAGMVVHPGHGNYTGTLVNALVYHFQNLPNISEHSIRPGLVHRIDKNTSGLLVIAKTEIAMSMLAKEFFDHTIDRTYQAFVWGDFKEDSGTVTGHIGRSLKDRLMMDVFPDGDHGREAITHYKVIERFGYVTLIECKLETGRTHQIRAHMKFMGHPLFNDATYGGDKIIKGTTFSKYRQFIDNCFKILPRQALHAMSLGFINPNDKKKILFESQLPDDFIELLEKWRGYSINKEL